MGYDINALRRAAKRGMRKKEAKDIQKMDPIESFLFSAQIHAENKEAFDFGKYEKLMKDIDNDINSIHECRVKVKTDFDKYCDDELEKIEEEERKSIEKRNTILKILGYGLLGAACFYFGIKA